MKIAVSFLEIKKNLIENIKKLNNAKISTFHFDIMDGCFVLNKTRDFEEDKQLAQIMAKPFDVHLMVKDVKKYVDWYAKLNPEWITFHLEIGNTKELIKYIKRKKLDVGISIKPDTSIEKIIPYLDEIDVVLLMSVPPGKGGQKFLKKTTARIEYLYKYRQQKNLSFLIQVDGGINDKTIKEVSKADVVVVGSYITKCKEYDNQVENLIKGVKNN